MKKDGNKSFGQYAEDLASLYLKRKGYQILTRNYYKPWGEIDIIAKDKDIYVFIEVKANRARGSWAFAPEVRVDWKKMSKIVRASSLYIAFQLKKEVKWRVDIISVICDLEANRARIRHHKNVAIDTL